MFRRSIRFGGLAAAALLLAASHPAFAQKSKDTLRYPIGEAEATLDRYLAPSNFANAWEPAVYDNLFGFDPKAVKFVPLLAKTWSQPDPVTYDIELNDNVKFHDGQTLTADDVVYTLNYLIDPKVNLRYKPSWAWIASVEKLSPTKLRVHAKQPDPDGLMWLTFGTPILPKHLHEPLADKQAFGAQPVGTGPYRVAKLDKNSGIVADRYADFRPGPSKPKPQIGHIVSQPMPDPGTVVASMLTGQSDVASNLPSDQAQSLMETGRFEVDLSPPHLGYNYLQFPTFAWKETKPLADVRVRKAIAMAIDRKVVIEVLYGQLGAQVPPTEGLCTKAQIGCGYTKLFPAYDPEGAKRLLAEAGYPNGFDVSITAYRENVPQATAISGMLRKVGINMSVKIVHSTQRVKAIKDGDVPVGYFGWSGGNMFTVSPQIVRHFQSGEYEDAEFSALAAPAFKLMDDAQRRTASAKAFDYLNEQAYVFPMVPNRETFTHTKEVGLLAPNDLRPSQIGPHEFVWK